MHTDTGLPRHLSPRLPRHRVQRFFRLHPRVDDVISLITLVAGFYALALVGALG